MHGIITKKLQGLNIPLKNLRGLATDGASVMTGKLNQRPSSITEEGCHQLSGSSLCMPQVSSGLHEYQRGTSSDKGVGDGGDTTVENL